MMKKYIAPMFVALVTIASSLPVAYADNSSSSAASSSSSSSSPAGTAQAGSSGQNSGNKPERMDVEAIRRKYWERGDDSDARVIQNRLYSKALKIEIGAYYGSISTDPFLTVRSITTTLGFHLTESWGFDFLYWHDFVSSSSAQASLQQDTATQSNPSGDSANTNPPRDFKGAEIAYSPIYGKLSLFGAMIIHYDLHFLAGYGLTGTQTGQDGTLVLGIGQQFYLTQHFSLRADYRALHFNETVPNSSGGTALTRGNWTDVITLGVTAFIGPL